jgi:hypothetical protein
MVDSTKVKLQWKLKSYLEKNGKTPYMLSRAMGGKVRTNETMLYRIEDGTPVRINTESLERILTGIQELGVREVSLSDVVECEP